MKKLSNSKNPIPTMHYVDIIITLTAQLLFIITYIRLHSN